MIQLTNSDKPALAGLTIVPETTLKHKSAISTSGHPRKTTAKKNDDGDGDGFWGWGKQAKSNHSKPKLNSRTFIQAIYP